jgi:mannose-6-phosphate isomerase-like protein (cupin superfamily)
MLASQYFSFDRCNFQEVIAHGGIGKIATDRVLSGSRETACDFVDLTILPAGSEIGVHTHGAEDEEYYVVISGAGEMHLEGRTFAVGPGDVIRNLPSGTHGLRNIGRQEIRLVVIQVPTRGATAIGAR